MSENRIVINDIPVKIDPRHLGSLANRKRGGNDIYAEYISIAEKIAKPKAIIKFADIDEVTETEATIEGRKFESVLLANKLKNQKKVFVVLITAGNEISETTEIKSGAIKNVLTGAVLRVAVEYVLMYLKEHFEINDAALLQPGSLPDWPIVNNLQLMDIIGDITCDAGVILKDNGYMVPWDTISGIYFAENGGYKNCMLCFKKDCIGRRAPFDKDQYIRIFGRNGQ